MTITTVNTESTLYERRFGRAFPASSHTLASEVSDLARHGAFTKTHAWRFVIGQTIDEYESRKKWGRLEDAARVFRDEPVRTGSLGLDAAVAALAAFLAERDGWTPPTWAHDPTRRSIKPWFVSESGYAQQLAREESPEPFRARGVFVTRDALARV